MLLEVSTNPLPELSASGALMPRPKCRTSWTTNSSKLAMQWMTCMHPSRTPLTSMAENVFPLLAFRQVLFAFGINAFCSYSVFHASRNIFLFRRWHDRKGIEKLLSPSLHHVFPVLVYPTPYHHFLVIRPLLYILSPCDSIANWSNFSRVYFVRDSPLPFSCAVGE